MKVIFATLIFFGAFGVLWLVGFVVDICLGAYGYGVGSWRDEPLEKIRVGIAVIFILAFVGVSIYTIAELL